MGVVAVEGACHSLRRKGALMRRRAERIKLAAPRLQPNAGARASV